jgi:ABC-type phosphate transport system ATPase subunit
MYMGKIIESGPTDEFFNHPVKQLTKDYLSGSFS